MTCIITPEGRHVVPPLTTGEGILYGDLDMALVTKRKRMMDSVGHYARPELLSLNHNTDLTPTRHARETGPEFQPIPLED
jgi:aliphatic nitrilase